MHIPRPTATGPGRHRQAGRSRWRSPARASGGDMSGQMLEVDSAAIRQAAEGMEQAAAAFGSAGQPGPSPLASGSLGHTAAAHAAVAAAGESLSRAQVATRGLAERSQTMAGALQTSATMFELVDSVIGAVR